MRRDDSASSMYIHASFPIHIFAYIAHQTRSIDYLRVGKYEVNCHHCVQSVRCSLKSRITRPYPMHWQAGGKFLPGIEKRIHDFGKMHKNAQDCNDILILLSQPVNPCLGAQFLFSLEHIKHLIHSSHILIPNSQLVKPDIGT